LPAGENDQLLITVISNLTKAFSTGAPELGDGPALFSPLARARGRAVASTPAGRAFLVSLTVERGYSPLAVRYADPADPAPADSNCARLASNTARVERLTRLLQVAAAPRLRITLILLRLQAARSTHPAHATAAGARRRVS
jgi:hypothetical protein